MGPKIGAGNLQLAPLCALCVFSLVAPNLASPILASPIRISKWIESTFQSKQATLDQQHAHFLPPKLANSVELESSSIIEGPTISGATFSILHAADSSPAANFATLAEPQSSLNTITHEDPYDQSSSSSSSSSSEPETSGGRQESQASLPKTPSGVHQRSRHTTRSNLTDSVSNEPQETLHEAPQASTQSTSANDNNGPKDGEEKTKEIQTSTSTATASSTTTTTDNSTSTNASTISTVSTVSTISTISTISTLSNSTNGSVLELSAFEAAKRGYFRHSMLISVILAIAYSIVFIVGIVGNSFVVAIVCKSPRMRTVTNYFIANLAFADILVLLFCLPATLVGNLFIRKYQLPALTCTRTAALLQPSLELA